MVWRLELSVYTSILALTKATYTSAVDIWQSGCHKATFRVKCPSWRPKWPTYTTKWAHSSCQRKGSKKYTNVFVEFDCYFHRIASICFSGMFYFKGVPGAIAPCLMAKDLNFTCNLEADGNEDMLTQCSALYWMQHKKYSYDCEQSQGLLHFAASKEMPLFLNT